MIYNYTIIIRIIYTMMNNSDLIINHTVFFAYFCYLIETNQADSVEDLCDIGWQLDEEIRKRKITNTQIKEYIAKIDLDPQDQFMVNTYIFPDEDSLNRKMGKS